MLVALRGSYDYSFYGPVYGMLNRQEAALQVALFTCREDTACIGYP
jgi:hypothetical protein